ncbi:pyrroloquinoline quinone precursor peptide PqqA [Neoroseomonas soli]|nr:pyrroloquinoline quinone precursor peptide PqqA [Neoroseomonas soli]
MSPCVGGILLTLAFRRHLSEEATMAWKTPKIVEISLALEINSYACAEID